MSLPLALFRGLNRKRDAHCVASIRANFAFQLRCIPPGITTCSSCIVSREARILIVSYHVSRDITCASCSLDICVYSSLRCNCCVWRAGLRLFKCRPMPTHRENPSVTCESMIAFKTARRLSWKST